MKTSCLLATSLLATMLGCGSGGQNASGGGGDQADQQTDQFLDSLGKAICAQVTGCCNADQIHDLFTFSEGTDDMDKCLILYKKNVTNHISAAIQSQEITYDASQSDACVKSVSALSCQDWLNPKTGLGNIIEVLPPACLGAGHTIVAAAQPGSACEAPWACTTGLCNFDIQTKKSTCGAPLPNTKDAACVDNCSGGFYCALTAPGTGTCQPVIPLGSQCGNFGFGCEPGTACGGDNICVEQSSSFCNPK
jgi:hypothetical protein